MQTPPQPEQVISRRRSLQRLLIMASAPALASALSACGFRLRGSSNGDAMRGIALQVKTTLALNYLDELRRQWQRSGGTWLEPQVTPNLSPNPSTAAPEQTAAAAPAPKLRVVTLSIDDSRYQRVAIATNSANLVREYELQYRVGFRLQLADTSGAMPPNAPLHTFTLRQLMSYNETQTLAKEYEEEQIKRNLERDAVRRILFQIDALSRTKFP